MDILPYIVVVLVSCALTFTFTASLAARRARPAPPPRPLAPRPLPPPPGYFSKSLGTRLLGALLALGLAGAATATRASPAPGDNDRCRELALWIALDVSRSHATPAELARLSAELVAGLPAGTRVGVATFGDGARVLLPATARDRATASMIGEAVAGIATRDAWTDVAAGLEVAAAELERERDATRVLVLVSDGVVSLPGAGGRDDAARARIARDRIGGAVADRLAAAHIRVQVLARTKDLTAIDLLTRLAERTRGGFRLGSDMDALATDARALGARLCEPRRARVPATAAASPAPRPEPPPPPRQVVRRRAPEPEPAPDVPAGIALLLGLLLAGASAWAGARYGGRPESGRRPAPPPPRRWAQPEPLARHAGATALLARETPADVNHIHMPNSAPTELPVTILPAPAPKPSAPACDAKPAPPDHRVFVAAFDRSGELHRKIDLRAGDDLWLFGPRGLIKGHAHDMGALRLDAGPGHHQPVVVMSDVPRGGFVDSDRGIAYDRGTRLSKNNVRFTWGRDPGGHIFEVIWK